MNTVHEAPGPLAALDLNLVVALDALLRLGSVTRAARQLGVSQSAMSHTLGRLREALGDPLLVRGRSGMVPTPRAAGLQSPLRAALVALSRALAAPAPFDPATTTRVFRLASPDLFDALVLPALVGRLAGLAPGASLAVVPGFADLAARLETGEIDVAIAPVQVKAGGPALGPALQPDLRTRRLFEDRFAAFVRAGHPVLAGPARKLGARAFAQLPHVLVSPTGQGGGSVDALLAARGLERRIVLRVPHFASAIAVVQQTDAVLVAPGALGLRARAMGLGELALPVPVPRHAITLVWHPRFDADPGQVWLRQQLVDSVARLRGS